MVKVIWTAHSIDDLKEIMNYISRDSVKYAYILKDNIFNLTEKLIKYPRIGRIVPEYKQDSIRELIYKNYRIIYLIKTESIEILTIFHGTRRLKLDI
jgi:toxin ParE1/3/4